MEDLDFDFFVKKIRDQTGIDLSQYKEQQMKRRLTTLRLKRGYTSFRGFYDGMQKNPALLEEFLERMTINVSEFWRNVSRWELLQQHYVPELLKGRSRLKCWSAACSTGEEPYSLAMILAEQGVLASSMITASDIDEQALVQARQGVYTERSLKEMPKPYIHKYFVQNDLLYHIDEKLKKNVRFEKMNILADRFSSSYDLIICRNVMIYFTDPAKQLLYQKFSEALRPGGVLFVGSTEQIFNPAQFSMETADTFFYRKMRN